jgi:hypothetical protein
LCLPEQFAKNVVSEEPESDRQFEKAAMPVPEYRQRLPINKPHAKLV